MKIEEVYYQLCIRDIRNPCYFDPIDPEMESLGDRCYCDNCFYGRHRLAKEILRLIDIAKKKENG